MQPAGKHLEKNRQDYTLQRVLNEKPGNIPGCKHLPLVDSQSIQQHACTLCPTSAVLQGDRTP